MRPIHSATPSEQRAIRKALEQQRKETGELDYRELKRRLLKSKKHPASPFFQYDREKAADQKQDDCCRAIIRLIKISYIDKNTGERIDAPKYIGVPTEGSFFDAGDRRKVLYEEVREYQEDPAKVWKVFMQAKEEFRQLCSRYYHNPMARPLCEKIRKLTEERSAVKKAQ